MNNVKRFVALMSLAFAYGTIYLLPYMKTTFYNQMLEATGFTNMQLGQMLSMYAIICTVSYLPGGWIADKISPRVLLTVCSAINALLCFVFFAFRTNFTVTMMVWAACGLTGGFAFWPSMLKGVRLLGTKDEQGRIYGIFELVNGLTSVAVAFIATFVASFFANMVAGFNGILICFGVIGLISSVFIWFAVTETVTVNEDAKEEKEKINTKEFFQVLLMPQVWIPSILLFVAIMMINGASYFNPYLSNEVGIAVGITSVISTINYYGTRIGGVFGGFMADKVLRSSAKWVFIAQILMTVFMLIIMQIPTTSAVLLVSAMLLFSCSIFASRATTYALLTEFKVPPKVTGTAIALMTLIGYVPDLFVHTWFGEWLDLYGSDGYEKIFNFVTYVGCAGIVVALAGVFLSKSINKKATA